MSENGWALIDHNWFRFTFRESKPQTREYFVYYPVDKKDSYVETYYMCKRLYGKGNNKSELNKNENSFCIFEVDTSKKDRAFDIAKKQRKKHIAKYYLILGLIFLLCALLLSIVSLSFVLNLLPITVFLLIPEIYFFVSLIILKFDK